ncbi:MAG: DUF2281 domain-containing protein [Bacteroidales bacterium]|nr:DUF2281 domain-containing protein [Bacteroidales bacterium]MCF8345162.1 DUF2281 domain-containing protein [Bacteroidales bacterium]MCF8351098.1 DUF2281 domain-containing protein [Bacteroidales bacterium]MCF8376804.1 DUF2281 domain-containing protein [Bacteroidales bacterium]
MDYSGFIKDFENLPVRVQKQIKDYVEFLSNKYQRKPNNKRKFSFIWEDGLSDLKSQFTSVELQHRYNIAK